jgi:hypothetical protein
MLITIEDFKEEHFDEILGILRGSFDLVSYKYPDEERKFGEDLLLEEFLSYPAKISRYFGMIKAGSTLNGSASFHIHENTEAGREAACKLVREIENAAKNAGNGCLSVFTLVDRSKYYLRPFQGYDVLNRNVDYPMHRKPEEGSMHLTWLEKVLG